MMDELVNEVALKTGLSQDQARAAVDSAVGFLKSKLPAPLASGLESMLAGQGATGADGLGGMLGGLFGKKS
jgi:hypothetical protein